MTVKYGRDYPEIADLAYWQDKEVDDFLVALLFSFENFLYHVGNETHSMDPTNVQYDIAEYLQFGPVRAVIKAFRGVGKTFVTSAFIVWNAWRNPKINIMVVSATDGFAAKITRGCYNLINNIEILNGLIPYGDMRSSTKEFDVPGSTMGKDPTMRCAGIFGQITGSRADIIIADDLETPENTESALKREKLKNKIQEFSAILKPNPRDGEDRPIPRVIYLGTPHTEDSLYNHLTTLGYSTRVWTARYPNAKQIGALREVLAPMILEKLEKDPGLMEGYGLHGDLGASVDDRFSETDLQTKEMEYAKSGFAMQYMLDTTLADADRYPLKLSDLIVHDLDMEMARTKYVGERSKEFAIGDLPCVGFNGDYYYRASYVSKEVYKYDAIVMAIDPSGRGKDETGYAVVAQLGGYLFLLKSGGLSGTGYSEEVMKELVMIAKKFKVQKIIVESNFGDGMYTSTLNSYLIKYYKCTVEETRASTQKEKRIIETLEPIMNSRRLIVSPDVIVEDFQKVPSEVRDDEKPTYRLFYQMSRITKEKGALVHDDRLDALEMACRYLKDAIALEVDKVAEEKSDEFLQEAYDDFSGFLRKSLGLAPKDDGNHHVWNKFG